MRAGNTLTVLNALGNGFFAQELGIGDQSPLLSVNNFGAGRVIYVNAFPVIQAGAQRDLLQPDLLAQVREAASMDDYVQRTDVLPVYNSTQGSIEVNGTFTLSTDALILDGLGGSTGLPFAMNGSTEAVLRGDITLTASNSSVLLFPSESYVDIASAAASGQLHVLVSSSNATVFVGGKEVLTPTGSISLNLSIAGLSALAHLPSVNASGTIIFDQLDVEAALYLPLAGIVQQKAEVQGSVRFSTLYATFPVIDFSGFQASGSITNLGASSLQQSIPWSEVLASPYNLTFNALFLIGLMTYVVTTGRRRRRTDDGVTLSGLGKSEIIRS